MNNKKKQLKEEFQREFNELTLIVNEWDPIGLIRGGAPDYEYESLTCGLLSQLHQGNNVYQLEEFIINELKKEFELDILSLKEQYKNRNLIRIKSTCQKLIDWYKR